MFGFKNKAVNNKLDKSTKEVLEIEAHKKRLEIEKDQIQLELENLKRKMRMQIEEEQHKHRLDLESKTAVFNREREIWEKEKEELKSKYEVDKVRFEEDLNRKLTLEKDEAITLTKLESQQQIKQAEIDKERAINDLKSEHAQKIADIQASGAEEHYEKLTKAFTELQMNGDKNTKFVQDMALKILEKTPTSRSEIGVNVDTPKLVKKEV